jgi:hypothetical protein
VLTTNQKGAIAETAIAHEAIKLGIGVYRPYIDERVDFLFDLGYRIMRIQCKWAAVKGDVLVVRLYSARRCANGVVTRCYTSEEIDAFAAYSSETGRCYLLELPEFAQRPQVRLRLGETRNNQRAGINWARDYEFAAKLGASGPVAQLGERMAGSH